MKHPKWKLGSLKAIPLPQMGKLIEMNTISSELTFTESGNQVAFQAMLHTKQKTQKILQLSNSH